MPATKKNPVKVTFAPKRPERDLLWDVYSYVVENWAVVYSELEEALKMPHHDVKRLTQKLAKAGLIVGEHVNSEKTLTWQSYHDVLNDERKGTGRNRNGEWKAARADFDKAFPEGTVKEPKAQTAAPKNAGTGPRYSPEQLEAGRQARNQLTDGDVQLTWKEVAEAAGVKSPHHFSKVLRATFADIQ